MSRQSRDERKNGRVWNGYDYSLQVWVMNGVCSDVGSGAKQYRGMLIEEIEGAENEEAV